MFTHFGNQSISFPDKVYPEVAQLMQAKSFHGKDDIGASCILI